MIFEQVRFKSLAQMPNSVDLVVVGFELAAFWLRVLYFWTASTTLMNVFLTQVVHHIHTPPHFLLSRLCLKEN